MATTHLSPDLIHALAPGNRFIFRPACSKAINKPDSLIFIIVLPTLQRAFVGSDSAPYITMAAPTTAREIPPPPGTPSESAAHSNVTGPHRQRDPAPLLSMDALRPLLRSFSPQPSYSQTPSSRYLSPPISVGSVASPPPRPEADDYFAAGARYAGAKRKHNMRQEHNSRASLYRSEGSLDSVPQSNITPPPSSLVKTREVELASSANTSEDGTKLAPPPACLRTVPPQERRRVLHLRNNMEFLPPDAKVTSPPAPLDVPEDSASPAVSALRRLSHTPTPPQDVGTGFVYLRRFSRTLTGSLGSVFTFKDAPPSISKANENAEFLAATEAHSADLDYGTGHHGHVACEEDGLSKVRATPATIILRKASAAVASQLRSTTVPKTATASSKLSRSCELPSHPHTPTASFLAFDSTRIQKQSPPISSTVASVQESDQASPPPGSPVRRLSFTGDYLPPRKKASSMSLLGNRTVNRRQSVTAAAALTTTEFSPCPGTLISPGSKPNLRSPEQALVRTSVVRFASRNSVHEIIWRENETSSSGTSPSPISPTNKETPSPKDTSPIKKPSESTDRDPFATLNAEIQTALDESPFLMLGSSVPPSPAQREAQEGFFAWSWENSPPPVMKSTFRLSKASTFGGVAGESLARFGDRRCTSDWRKKPLVDLHESVADGEESQSPGVSDPVEEESEPNIKREMQRSKTTPTVLQSDKKVGMRNKTEKGSRVSSFIGPLVAPAKVRIERGMGRSVDVSSDMKVRSGK